MTGRVSRGGEKTRLQSSSEYPSFTLIPSRALPILLFSRGVIIVNHLITEARVNPGFWARWKVSRWAPQTLSCQQIKADALWWSYTMLLWYCSTQRSAGLGWMTKFDCIFQPIPSPCPFKVMQKAPLIMHAFMSGCFVVRGQVDVLTHLVVTRENTQFWKSWTVKLSVFVSFEVSTIITRGLLQTSDVFERCGMCATLSRNLQPSLLFWWYY